MIWLSLLRRAAPYLITIALVGGWSYLCYDRGVTTEREHWQAEWAKRDTADADARAAAERTQRTEEQRRADWAAGVQRDAAEELGRLQTNADGATADNQRLRDELAKLQTRLGGPRQGAGAAVSSASATRAAMVLSELYGNCQGRLTELSAAFDRARIAGLACERSYQGMKR